MGRKWHAAALGIAYAVAIVAAAADDVANGHKGLSFAGTVAAPEEVSSPRKLASLHGTTYHHVWPPMKFGWQIALGSFVGFFRAAFGSVGGVGGGGFFVPMLTLIIGFDPKSSAAMSKCMITGAAVSSVYCNLKLKHPTLDMPMIDYDLALLIQPMLMMGVSIGVICNEAKAKQLEQSNEEIGYTPPPTEPDVVAETKKTTNEAVSIWKNIYWKEFGLLAFVWVAFLTLQVIKNYAPTCSTWYWVLTMLQIPVSVGVSMYQAAGLVQGKRAISSSANNQTRPKAHQILVCCFFGVTASVLAGLLGVGGGTVMGPLFLELGIHPQVSSATVSFAMMFSSSMAAVEYYLLKRFPVPYALFFSSLAFVAANCWPAGRKEAGQLVRAGIIQHLHTVLHDLRQHHFSRWSRHLQDDSQDGAARVHGIRQHLQLSCVGRCCPHARIQEERDANLNHKARRIRIPASSSFQYTTSVHYYKTFLLFNLNCKNVLH